MILKVDITNRVKWLSERINLEDHEKDLIRFMIKDAIFDALMKVKKDVVLDDVSKCDCPPLVACEICGEEENLDGDFWKNKKKHER